MKYLYECPTKKWYKRFKITNKQQNSLFKYRQSKFFIRYEYYMNDKEILMYQIPTLFACVLSTLLFPIGLPIGLLLEGVVHYKDAYKIMVADMWKCKENGAFSSDRVYKGRTYDSLIKCAKYY